MRVEQQAIELFDGTRMIAQPKTAAGRRTVAVPDLVVGRPRGASMQVHRASRRRLGIRR